MIPCSTWGRMHLTVLQLSASFIYKKKQVSEFAESHLRALYTLVRRSKLLSTYMYLQV